MKKLIACAVLIGATCAFAEESYLYWMIDPEATITEGELPKDLSVRISAFKQNTQWVYGGADSYLTLYDWSNGSVGSAIANSATQPVSVDYGSQYFAAVPQDGLNWTYYVELYNDSIFARSDALNLTAESIVALAGMDRPGTLWNVKAFVPAAVPEPNSGLLLLLGVAGLALRRRKQIAA